MRLDSPRVHDNRNTWKTKARFALPSLVTLLAVACGFASIALSVGNAGSDISANFQLAAYLLVLAGVFDALDGFVARATGTCSDFGVQLDSIADVMNFGCAPAILLYSYGFEPLRNAFPVLQWLGGFACFSFAACGALRLARFNVQVGKNDPRYFVGMPITAGAACVASVVVAWPAALTALDQAVGLAALLVLVSLLMVSTLRFPSSKQNLPRGAAERSLSVVAIVAIAALFAEFGSQVFAGFFAAYIVFTLALNLAWRSGWTGIAPAGD